MSLNETFSAASRSCASLAWNSSRYSSGTRPTSRKLMTCPSFIAAPFIVPSAATICSAVSTCRRASAAPASSSERVTFAARVAACLAPWVAARRPTLAARVQREVGMRSWAIRADVLPAALDLRARHDVVLAVRPADPGLVAAVVVVAEQHQRRRLAERRARLVALAVQAAPDPHEAVALPLLRGRRRVGVPGSQDRLRRREEQHVHDRGLEVLVARAAGGADPADGVLEQRVAAEEVALDQEAQHARRVPRGVERHDLEASRRDRLARLHRAGRLGDLVALGRVDEHLHVGPALLDRGDLGDVVVVMVGEQDVRRRQVVAADRVEQRLHRPAGVDEERLAARLGRDQVGVREELRVHRPLEDHARHSTRAGRPGLPGGRVAVTLPAMSALIHTCYRIGDIDRSVAFYEALGMQELRRMPIREEAINVFMGFPDDGARLELTYNFGVDSYELGTGYNHIAITVDSFDTVLPALAEKGIEPEKPPYTVREGGNRLCFVRDPDGYRVELIETGA